MEVLSIVGRHAPKSRTNGLHADSELAGLGIGSLELVGLILDLEGSLGVAYPPEMMDRGTFETPRRICESVLELRGRLTA